MKIKYEFVTGESSVVEVEEEIGTFVLDSRRIERNANRKEHYHRYSSDGAWEGEEYASRDTPESLLIQKYDNSLLVDGLNALSAIQRKRLLMYASGLSMHKIAAIEGTSYHSVNKSIEQARKKIKKFI